VGPTTGCAHGTILKRGNGRKRRHFAAIVVSEVFRDTPLTALRFMAITADRCRE
jgi:hypothetical protein